MIRPILPVRKKEVIVYDEASTEVPDDFLDDETKRIIQKGIDNTLLNRTIHTHKYIDKGEFFLCPCGKRKLKLQKTNIEGIRFGIKKDGKKYTVRDHRIRSFFPGEWIKVFDNFKDEHKLIFDLLIQSGARIDEVRHIRPHDFDFDRNTVRLWKTKTRAALGERSGKPRTIILSSQFIKRLRKYLKDNRLDEQSSKYLFPAAKEDQTLTKQGIYQLFRRAIERAGIKDPYNFSLHNIRKTHGNWLKAIGIDSGEICLRLGHDLNTFQKHYGSATIYNNQDMVEIRNILGDLYANRRMY